MELEKTVYALDSTTIDLCLSVFPWARFRKRKGAIKLHTLLDLRGNIPTFVEVTEGRVHDVNILDYLLVQPGSIYILDRGYLDFARLYRLHQSSGFFIIRAAPISGYSHRVQEHRAKKRSNRGPERPLHGQQVPRQTPRVRYYDAETQKHLVFLSNNFSLTALTVAQLYRCRWRVAQATPAHQSLLYFSERRISVYILVLKKRLKLEQPLHNSTDSQPDCFRENPINSSTYQLRLQE